jgi:predicted nucleic acid-binding protein
MRQRIYIDTSVIGGYFDEEFEADTRLFFERIFNKDFDIFISEISTVELLQAPEHVKEVMGQIPSDCLTKLEFSEDAQELASNYLKEKILGAASLNDAYHIAIATANRIDILVSWNFRHIVNVDKIRLFNAVNLKLGYPVIDIRSPNELIKYED